MRFPRSQKSHGLILASTSAYRRELLARLRLPFETAAPDIDETPMADEAPAALALRLAIEKARAVARRYPEDIVIGSDQVAVVDGAILGKPLTRENAIRQLRRSSGRTARFHTAICLARDGGRDIVTDSEICSVVFRELDDARIERYVDLDRPYGCAGSFKAEGLGIALFQRIEGEDPNALIGLPLIRLVRLLEAFRVKVI